MSDVCPKCGAGRREKISSSLFIAFDCDTRLRASGMLARSDQCRIRELTAENKRLAKEVAILREAIGELWLMPAKEEQQATGDELVDRLRGIYTVPVNDGAGQLNGKDTFTQCFNVAAIKHKAADEIERLRAELKALASPPHTR